MGVRLVDLRYLGEDVGQGAERLDQPFVSPSVLLTVAVSDAFAADSVTELRCFLRELGLVDGGYQYGLGNRLNRNPVFLGDDTV